MSAFLVFTSAETRESNGSISGPIGLVMEPDQSLGSLLRNDVLANIIW